MGVVHVSVFVHCCDGGQSQNILLSTCFLLVQPPVLMLSDAAGRQPSLLSALRFSLPCPLFSESLISFVPALVSSCHQPVFTLPQLPLCPLHWHSLLSGAPGLL